MLSRLDLDVLPYPGEKFKAMKAYGQPELCNALMAVELQRRFADQGRPACYLHPGTIVTTDMGRDSAILGIAMKLVSPFTKTANLEFAARLWELSEKRLSDKGYSV
jgi:hypothetical protein